MNEEFSGDEFLLFRVSAIVAISGAATWYVPVTRVARLGFCKRDSQVGDVTTLADFPIILRADCWRKVAALAEQLTAETLGGFGGLIAEPGDG